MAGFLLVTFYAAMAGAALIVEFVFQGLGLVPTERDAKVVEATVTWNYTTVLNILFLGLAAVLVWRYFRRGGGIAMLRMMEMPMDMEHGYAAHQARYLGDRSPAQTRTSKRLSGVASGQAHEAS